MLINHLSSIFTRVGRLSGTCKLAYGGGVSSTHANPDGLAWTLRRWPDPEAGPYEIGMAWAEVDGRPECVEVTVKRGGAPVPATALRQLPLGDFIAADRAAQAPAVVAVGGMRKSAADRLKLAAELYQAALAAGQRPTKAVAEHFGISPGGASNLVARARAAGLLPPTSAGKAVG